MKQALEHLNANRYDGTDLVPLSVARDAINIALTEKNNYLKELRTQLIESNQFDKDSIFIKQLDKNIELWDTK